jgi:uncharacterized protein YbjT (DUF2867 family)
VSLHLRLLRSLPLLPVIGSGRQLLQPIALGDLAAATVLALGSPPNVTYDAVGPLRLTLLDLQSLIMRMVGRRRPRVHLPIMLARLAAPFFERAGSPPLLTRDQLLLLREDNVGDPVPLQHDLRIKLQQPQEALAYLRGLDLAAAGGVRIG